MRGAIDLYTHASPDLLPRRGDDLALARDAQSAGLAAAVHRHHFSPTAERARIAADATGFRLLGAILLNDPVGGLNPDAVELALRMGAVWVGMPTLMARWYRGRLGRLSPERRKVVGFGRGDLVALDDSGKLLPVVDDILTLVAEHDVALNLGYLSFAEGVAVVRAAVRHRIGKITVTNPTTSGGLGEDQLLELMREAELLLELTCYSMYPGRVGGPDLVPQEVARLVRLVGASRCVLSSDAGTATAPAVGDLFAWGITQLAEQGIAVDDLRILVQTNPARLLA